MNKGCPLVTLVRTVMENVIESFVKKKFPHHHCCVRHYTVWWKYFLYTGKQEGGIAGCFKN